jgi:hypothetical protein
MWFLVKGGEEVGYFFLKIKEIKNLQNDDGRWENCSKQLWKNGIKLHEMDSQ